MVYYHGTKSRLSRALTDVEALRRQRYYDLDLENKACFIPSCEMNESLDDPDDTITYGVD